MPANSYPAYPNGDFPKLSFDNILPKCFNSQFCKLYAECVTYFSSIFYFQYCFIFFSATVLFFVLITLIKVHHFFLILFSSFTCQKQQTSSSKLFFHQIFRHLQNSTLIPIRRMLPFIENRIATSIFKHSKDFITRFQRTARQINKHYKASGYPVHTWQTWPENFRCLPLVPPKDCVTGP